MLTSLEDTPPTPGDTFAVEGVSKRYGPTQALTDVSLTFPAGQVTAVLGENGAGKSTLLNILAGATRPTGGRLLMGGRRLVLRDPGDARANGIAIIPQVPEVIESLSVAENILLSRLPNGLAFSRSQARARAGELIERWGLRDFLDPRAHAGTLSAAGRQLVEILRATYAQPRLVAFDEPTSALGPYEVERLRAVVRRMRDEGVAVVYVSHRWAEIQALSSRIAVLRDGRLVQVHETGDVPLLDILVEMGGRAATERFQRTGAVQDAAPRLAVRDVSTAKLRHVSVSIRPGEIVGVAGLEGSGRSELARVIVGDVSAHTGSVEVDGRSLSARLRRSPLRSRIGYTPEDRHAEGLLPERSVQANVVLASLPRLNRAGWVDRRGERTLARDLRSRLDIRCSSLSSSVASLSGGNQQKVVVARSLAVGPVVWVLDDPSKGIDISTKQALYAFLDEYAASGRSALLISSEIAELLTICDRIVVMHLGRIVADLQAGSATEHQVMEAMFGHPSTPGGTDAESAGPESRQGVVDHVN